MQANRFTEAQIVNILKEAESGISVQEIERKYGVSKTTFYVWRTKYAGMTTDLLSHLRALEEENARLKRMYAELGLEYQALKEIVRKKL
jgi:putative transposase